MARQRRISLVVMALTLLGLAASATPSWGQTEERIGTVLAVDGTAEARAANATTWEPLQFRAAIFAQDTVRTGADSKVKILLRDDSIMTLAERSEMQFTEFLLTPQQRRTVVSLALGKLRVVTTKIFGAGSATEVRTPNTVAGVRGTTFVVIFIPPDTTEVLGLDGVVTVRNLNPAIPQIEPVPQNFRTRVLGNTAPEKATELSPTERQALERDMRLTEQVPLEVQPSSESQTAGAVRGEEGPETGASLAAGPAARLGALPNEEARVAQPPRTSVTQLTSVAQQAETIIARGQSLSDALASAPPNTSPLITPDNPTNQAIIQQQQSLLRLTITIPRPR
jgi:hypothetical protein